MNFVVTLTLFAFVLVLGLCAVAGWTVDSRDFQYGLWPLATAPTSAPDGGAHHGERSS